MRPLSGNRPLPDIREQGHRDHGEPERPHDRLLRPDLRRGRPGRRGQDPRDAHLSDLQKRPPGRPRNYEGVISVYTEPEPSEAKCPDEDELRREFPGLENREGVATLLRDGRISIAPAGLERQSRSDLYKKGKLKP